MKSNKSVDIHSSLQQTTQKHIIYNLVIIICSILLLISFIWPFMFSMRLGMITQMRHFRSENFEKIATNAITDSQGTVVFLDDEFNTVYPESSSLVFTEEQVNDMVDVEMLSQSLSTFEYIENDIKYTQISSNGETSDTSWFLIIDESGNYVESNNFHMIQDVYSSEDIDFILSNEYIKNARDYKYHFTSDHGNEYYMIVSLESRIQLFEVYEVIIIGFVVILIIVLYRTLLRVPNKRLSRRIMKPINDLSLAMDQYTLDDPQMIEADYDLEEFNQIVHRFNEMTYKLKLLEDKNKEMSTQRKDMIAAIAHDLKTPITIITGYIEAIKNNKIQPGDYDEYYQKILDKSHYLSSLISEFSLYSSLEHHEFQLKCQTLDLNQILQNYLAKNYLVIEDHEFTLSVELSNDVIKMDIDVINLERALDNILGNFLKYNNKGTNIYVSTSSNEEETVIIFKKNGTPIPKEIALTLFDPFIVGEISRTNASTGLGLSITKRIIELHKGTIEYQTDDIYCNQFIIRFKRH